MSKYRHLFFLTLPKFYLNVYKFFQAFQPAQKVIANHKERYIREAKILLHPMR